MSSSAVATKWVYDFAEGSRDMRDLLGGKGANVAEMTRILGPDRVPAGFTITTEACVEYMRAGKTSPEGLSEQVDAALARLEENAGKRLGDPDDPLLVSVRRMSSSCACASGMTVRRSEMSWVLRTPETTSSP